MQARRLKTYRHWHHDRNPSKQAADKALRVVVGESLRLVTHQTTREKEILGKLPFQGASCVVTWHSEDVKDLIE